MQNSWHLVTILSQNWSFLAKNIFFGKFKELEFPQLFYSVLHEKYLLRVEAILNTFNVGLSSFSDLRGTQETVS